MRRAPIVLALAVALLAPAAASARSSLVAFGSAGGDVSESYGFVGPALAGESIVYARGDATGLRVRRVDGSGDTGTIGSIPGFGGETFTQAVVEASEQRVGVGEEATACQGDCRTGTTLLADRVFSAPLTGPLARIGGCGPGGPPCGSACFITAGSPAVSVDGTAVAFRDPCARQRVVVRDDGGAQAVERSLELPSLAGDPALAGRFVAWPEAERPGEFRPVTVVVYDWVAEREAYRFDARGLLSLAVQDDGKAAYAIHEGESSARVWWASPSGEPRTHPGPLFPTPSLQVRIGRDRIAARARAYGTERLSTLAVVDLAGREFARHEEPATIGRWDFDGTRLAWATRPCERVAIVAWDLADARPPALPAGHCPLPAITTRSTSLDGKSFRLGLRCPAEPALGCLGRIRLVAHAPRGERYALGTVGYEVAPGRSTRLAVTLPKAPRTFVTRHRRVTVAATAIGESRSGLEIAGEFLTRTSSFRLAR